MAPPPKLPPFDLGRRRFLTGVAGAAGALSIPGCGTSPLPLVDNLTLPDPATSGIDHIIVVMMENRSFDHYLGWLPGADGKQAGLKYYDKDGVGRDTYPLAPEFQSCGKRDPDHSHEGGLVQFNNGRCDGFMRTPDGSAYPAGDVFPLGYFTQADLAFTGAAAPAFTVYDRYFSSIMAETYPNRFYMHSAQTPRMHNGPIQNTVGGAVATPEIIATIWDRLADAGKSGAYYYNDTPFLGLWGRKYLDNGVARPYSSFASDAAAGMLANAVYIDPAFQDEDRGTSRDDHPFADIRDGQAFLSDIYNAVVKSPLWSRTALFITYDEWGGFYDHVPPPDSGVIPEADRAACEKEKITPFSLMGFRVPTIAISPYARRSYVSSTPYDHCSILKMIEWRFGLPTLTVRDAAANNIAASFDFASKPDLNFPSITAPAGPFGVACPARSLAGDPAAALAREQHRAEWRALKKMAIAYGYPARNFYA